MYIKKNTGIGILLYITVFLCHQQMIEAKEPKENRPVTPIAIWNDESLTLDNGTIKRIIHFSPKGEIYSTSYRFAENEFLSPQSPEFSMLVDDKRYTGLSGWEVLSVEKEEDATGGSGASILLHPVNSNAGFKVKITYMLYPNLPAVRKRLTVINTGDKPLKVEEVDIELLRMVYLPPSYLSNVEHLSPFGPLRVRNLAWGRTPALPATSLVIGNLTMDHPLRLFCFQSLAGSLPIMLGDPRRLNPDERKEMKEWSDWLRDVEQRHGYSEYRQDLPGYGEPVEGAWDGFARINTETKSGGLIGIFRQGAAEDSRVITVPYLDASTLYIIKQAPTGEVTTQMTGKELEQKGFKVTLKESYQGMLYEITKR